jgi:hypothetical protein
MPEKPIIQRYRVVAMWEIDGFDDGLDALREIATQSVASIHGADPTVTVEEAGHWELVGGGS